MKKRRFIILLLCAAVLVVGILIVVLLSKQPVLYRVTYLPSLGGQFTLPCSINDRGQIAGFSKVSRGTNHLFLWDHENGIQDLGPGSIAYINNAGQIASSMQDPNGHRRAFFRDPNGTRRILPTLGGEKSTAFGINNHGQVVGASETASGICHAFAWDNVNGIRDLTPSSSVQTSAQSINDIGKVIVSAKGGLRLVNINEGMTSNSPSIPLKGLSKINNNGYVTGVVQTAQSKFDIGIWHPDLGMKKLLQLNLDSSSTAKINDVNQIIFLKQRQPKFNLFVRKMYYTPLNNYLEDPKLGRISLNGYVSIGRGEVFCLIDINNKGQIIGAVQSTKGQRSRGVLLEPIHEKWDKK
jgi:probable HAF family extracellular repeat protein